MISTFYDAFYGKFLYGVTELFGGLHVDAIFTSIIPARRSQILLFQQKFHAYY